MANNPKKVKDPTEVALSAIQEALNIGDASPVENDRASVTNDMTTLNERTFDTRPGVGRDSSESVQEPRSSRRAANDDRETIGQILQAIQKGRPARNVYTLATIFAVIWSVGAALLTIGFLPSLQATVGHGSAGTLALAGLVAVFFAPVLLFY